MARFNNKHFGPTLTLTCAAAFLPLLAHADESTFDGRVLAVSEDVMLKRRLLAEQGRKARHMFSQPDLILAATALQHGLTIVTRDAADYEKAGARTFNPWPAPSF